jgi:hypothetical protein
MPPIAGETHPSQDDPNNTEDLEDEESDEYDIEVGGNWFLFSLCYTLPHRTTKNTTKMTKTVMRMLTRKVGKVDRTV